MELAGLKNQVINIFSSFKSRVILFIKICIAVGLLVFLGMTIRISEVIIAVDNANYFLIFLALILLVPNVFLQYWKWNLTCSSVLDCGDKRKILISLFHGFAAGAFTPFRVGEYVGRSLLFTKKTLLQVTVATLIDKFFPLSVLAFVGSLASILFIYTFYAVPIYISVALFIVVLTLFYFFLLFLLNPEFWSNIIFDKIRKPQRLYKLIYKVRFLGNLDRNYSLKMFLISALFYFCFVTQFIILVSAFSNQFYFIDYLWSAFLIMFTKTFFPAISFSELGIREGVSVFFLGQMGVNPASAFNAALFLFFINILIPSLIGSVFLFKKNNV